MIGETNLFLYRVEDALLRVDYNKYNIENKWLNQSYAVFNLGTQQVTSNN